MLNTHKKLRVETIIGDIQLIALTMKTEAEQISELHKIDNMAPRIEKIRVIGTTVILEIKAQRDQLEIGIGDIISYKMGQEMNLVEITVKN